VDLRHDFCVFNHFLKPSNSYLILHYLSFNVNIYEPSFGKLIERVYGEFYKVFLTSLINRFYLNDNKRKIAFIT